MLKQMSAPVPLMLTGSLLSLMLVALAVFLASQGPWLGLEIAYDETRQLPVVTNVHRLASIQGELGVGDHLERISAPDSADAVDLRGFQLRVEPPSHARFSDHNLLLEREGEIAAILAQPKVVLTTEEGAESTVSVWSARPISNLGYEFWLFNLFGLIAWNISLAVWAIRPGEVAARLLCLSGAGFFTATFFNSIYLARELALPQDVFWAYSRANVIGLYIMLFSLLALMAYYPRRITRVSPALYLVPVMLVLQFNETYQWYEWPLHAFYLPIFAFYLTGVVVAAHQWRVSIDHPLDRAALKWMLLAIFIIMGLGLAIYFVPLALFDQAIFPQWAMVGTASLLYIGFAFGIVRYRLFDVERWWLEVWAWFLGGLSVVLFDLALITLMNIQPMIALGVALIAVGWVYFPLRQMIWKKLHPDHSNGGFELTEQIERIAETMPSQHTDPFWIRLLEEAYQPADLYITNQQADSVRLLDNGAAVIVPLLSAEGTVRLTFPNRGRRLFSLRDRRHLESLLAIARRMLSAHKAELSAVQRERERIVRDLHDNLGGHLMTLLRRAPTADLESQARKALKALRETMRVLDGNPLQDVTVILEDLRADVEERLVGTGVAVSWEQSLEDDSLEITMRQAINISHILLEAVSNALEHADSKKIHIQINVDERAISLEVINDGAKAVGQDKKLLRGRGLNNMSVRASELGGSFSFGIADDVASLQAVLPINGSLPFRVEPLGD